MKRLMMCVVGGVALMAGNAYAGGGCNYGSHASKDASEAAVVAAAEETNPELLAKLKKQEAEADALEKLIETPVIHN